MAALPSSCRPATREEGYAVQERVMAHAGRGQFGWKIAATSSAGQRHIGVDGPLAGRLLEGQIVHGGATVSLSGTQMGVAEPEFALRLGRDLPPRPRPYRTEEVMAAVDTLHPSIEVPDSRFADFASAGGPQLIADNACAHLFVFGPAARAYWRSIDLGSHTVRARVEGRYERSGTGANVLGGPHLALTWIANELSVLGIGLRAGQVVTTGTCMVPLEVVAGDRMVVDFGVLGSVEARFDG
ncbi:MAG: fumarylacetoacetate hydrolase family protein [Burkholderiales bacterium]|nr:fumarylacetoacetate hydrolase family protein [Burkholderiales bacterium]